MKNNNAHYLFKQIFKVQFVKGRVGDLLLCWFKVSSHPDRNH